LHFGDHLWIDLDEVGLRRSRHAESSTAGRQSSRRPQLGALTAQVVEVVARRSDLTIDDIEVDLAPGKLRLKRRRPQHQ
jgi:hypothetical protein